VDLVEEEIDIKSTSGGDVREHHVIPHHLARAGGYCVRPPEYLLAIAPRTE